MRYLTPLGLAALALLCQAPDVHAQGKASIAVAPFTYHQSVRAQPGTQLETATLTNKFVTALVQTRKFDVVERERLDTLLQEMELSESGLTDPARAVEAGQMLGADYFLLGEISTFHVTTEVRPIPHTTRWNRFVELVLICDMRIVDTRTGRIVSAETGDARRESREMHRARPGADAPVDPAELDAIQRDCVDQLVLRVIDAVYPVRIISINSRGVCTLNRGEGGGLAVGQQLDAYSEGEELIDPDTGEVLGSEEERTGRIEVTEILARFSKARIVGGAPEQGNVCREASGPANFAPPPPPRDTTPPRIQVLAPRANQTLNTNPINVVVSVTDNEGVARVVIAGAAAQQDSQGNWRCRVGGRAGSNLVRVEAYDLEGNQAVASVTFEFDDTPPEVEADATILVEGRVDDLNCTLTINGQQVQYNRSTGAYSARVPADPNNPGRVTIIATDQYGNATTEVRVIR